MTNQEEREAIAHMSEFTKRVAIAIREFVLPLDPTEGESEMEYIRDVLRAADNLILTALMQADNKDAVEHMDGLSESMIQTLVEYHNKDREIH